MSVRPIAIAFAAVLFTALQGGAVLASPAREPATVEGVRQAEARWNEAFLTGDSAGLDRLLDASYVSVSAAGKPRTKAEIIAAAQAYAAEHKGAHASAAASGSTPTSTIRLIGRSAIVRHQSAEQLSVDVLYYQNGQWRAAYSQHTAVAPAN